MGGVRDAVDSIAAMAPAPEPFVATAGAKSHWPARGGLRRPTKGHLAPESVRLALSLVRYASKTPTKRISYQQGRAEHEMRFFHTSDDLRGVAHRRALTEAAPCSASR